MAKRNEKAMGVFSTMVSRSYEATVEQVFRAWTDPASVRAWLAGGKQAIVDPRVNGLFYIEMPWKERIYPHYGRYLRVEAPSLLEFTWVSEGSEGKESVVLIEIVGKGKQTDLRLTHDGLPSDESAKSHHGGWSDFAEQLAPLLKKEAA